MFCVEPQAFALLFWRCMFARCYPKHGGHWYYEALGITEKILMQNTFWDRLFRGLSPREAMNYLTVTPE